MTLDVFSVKENLLFGSEIPRTQEDFDQLKALGIKVIISFTDEILEVKRQMKFDSEFIHHEMFIIDYSTPTKSQVEEFISLLRKYRDEKQAVLVHCWAGCGRTGLMLVLAERFVYGEDDPETAIANVKKVRSCAVETIEQREFAINYQL
ncbi:MAG: phosphatase domain-containing putative toxin [Candidatus Heimdallarchaeota archaeon]